MRVLTFAPYRAADWATAEPQTAMIWLWRALHDDENQKGDDKRAEELAAVQDAFEVAVAKTTTFRTNPANGEQVPVEEIRARPEGASITLKPESRWDLLRACWRSYLTRVGVPVKQRLLVNKFLDDVAAVKEEEPKAEEKAA